ncbi:hypothetical protein L3X38_003629 [Prunus dulcis]|uniref:hAT-like transposase RNase-H fold domain-containing protein n=1 Tax=Prunus dulcis TaxID=3755 RepID=A0AAD4ZMF2_PRUDU|nr:hypothetical protein L3X38_003629 [Prunus dulcis]
MIIGDELPFSHVENVGFRDLMREVQPKFDPASRRTIARDVWNLFQLENEKVFTITVDNATPSDKMISYMKGMKELDNSIVAISNSVRYIHSSAARWNSTYLLLEGALKYQKAFERMLEDDGDPHFVAYFTDDDVEHRKKRVGPPTSNDWDCARVMIKFLKLYYEATLKFSGSKEVTSHQAFHQMCAIFVQLQKFCRSEDSLMKSIATSMKRKFDKYWGKVEDINKLLLITIVLDP